MPVSFIQNNKVIACTWPLLLGALDRELEAEECDGNVDVDDDVVSGMSCVLWLV